MAFLTEGELRSKSSIAKSKLLYKSANQILNESYRNFSAYKVYDIFLSHSFLDAELILGLKEHLEEFNLSVYVDWIEDNKLDRSKVNRETADLLRTRMRACKSLIYAVSDKSDKSRWMPWELGYFDGHKNGKVAIMPITQNTNDQFIGEEYLLLYKYVEKIPKTYSFEKDKLKINGVEVKTWIG
ncbi:MAG: hypothetical protein APF81_26705 [Desulfosporosinus sp. BRH_c37]|nr:MAG: hypothetical protein APF81_26705 [Desulfosporosinus sp. BRH_c37]